MIRHALILLWLVLGIAIQPATAQEPEAERAQVPMPGTAAPAAPQAGTTVTFERELSQTSVWPGDRFHYRITLMVPAETKVSLDDFDRKAVNLKPFELTDTQRITEELEQGVTRYIFDYLLTNYEIGDRPIEVPRVIFHYEKADVAGKEPSTTEVQIPAMPIAVRSTLVQPARETWIRERLPVDVTESRAWIASIALGVGGLVISLIPLLTWVWNQVPQWRSRERKLSQKKFMQQCTRSLDALGKGLDRNAEEVRRQYQALEGIAHQYVRYFWNMDAAGLTSSELTGRLQKANIPSKQTQVLGSLLEHGQNCRYSPGNGTDWAAVFQQDLREVRNALRTQQR